MMVAIIITRISISSSMIIMVLQEGDLVLKDGEIRVGKGLEVRGR